MKKQNDDKQEYSKDHCHKLLIKKVSSKIYQLFISEFSSLDHEKKHWEKLHQTLIIKPYFTKQEIEELLLGKEFWLDATEICQRGICTGVSIFGTVMSPELYVDYSKNKKSKDELIRQLKNVNNNLLKKDRDFIDSVSTKNPD